MSHKVSEIKYPAYACECGATFMTMGDAIAHAGHLCPVCSKECPVSGYNSGECPQHGSFWLGETLTQYSARTGVPVGGLLEASRR